MDNDSWFACCDSSSPHADPSLSPQRTDWILFLLSFRKKITVRVLNATLDVSTLVLVGVSALLKFGAVSTLFMWGWVLVYASASWALVWSWLPSCGGARWLPCPPCLPGLWCRPGPVQVWRWVLDSVSADPCGFCVVLTPALVFLIPFLSGEGVGWRVSGW